MKRLLALLSLALAQMFAAQVKVTPVQIPHQTFFDASGVACALCKLYSYSAGTNLQLATYTDSTGTSQNQNPIILDVAGGANIWVSALSYKFVLASPLGSTIWSIDNVKAGGGGAVPCSSSNAIQYADTVNSVLACDPTITIDPASHSILVGGAISGPFFSMHNMSPIPTSWTFDVTTPATALASLGTVPYSSFPTQASDTLIGNISAITGKPTALALPSNCSQGINYSTASHSFTCVSSGNIPLSTLATQAHDSVVMNATGISASPTAVSMASGCLNGVNYSTSTHTWTCTTATPLTCSGSTPPWSCYSVDGQGVITEFGVVLAPTTSNTVQTVSISFPYTFPTQQMLTVSGGSQPDGTNDAYTVYHTGLGSTGALAVIRCSVNIGGAGCSSISNQIPIHWEAKGK